MISSRSFFRLNSISAILCSRVLCSSGICDMTDLHGWSLGGFWAELKFDAKHAKDFRRVALITGKPLHRFMASMLKPFTSAEIKCFQQEKKSDALTWISHN